MEANFRVGQYVLERPLGIGGMAEVWLARNAILGTPAAIKFLNPAYASVAEIEQRFLNEGKRQGALNHPNIIKVYGFEYVDNRSFLILQYVDGEPLDQVLRRVGHLNTPEAMRIAISVLNALDYAHEHNIVHRDIKPSNILLDENRIPYLGDFGIVLATNEKRLTRAGTAMGTALYMSPEQITDPGSVDRRADIYSMGCVIYEMLTGQPPFNPEHGGATGDTDFAVKMAHVQQPPPPLRSRNPALSAELEAVVMRCLAKSPGDRYRTCREVRDALSAAMVARPYVTPSQVVVPPAQPIGPPSQFGMQPSQMTVPPLYGGAPHPMAAAPPTTVPPVGYVPPPVQKKSKAGLFIGLGVALVALIVVLVLVMNKSKEPPVETEQQKQERLKQEALKEQAAKDEAAKKDKAQQDAQLADEVKRAKSLEGEFMTSQAQLKAGLGDKYHALTIHNNCAKSDFDVAATYKDLQGNWVVHGWWNVTALQSLTTNIYSSSGVMYFYGSSSTLRWNAGSDPIDAQVADNAFAHKVNEPVLGKNKHTVKMTKQSYGDAFGTHTFTITCGT